MTKRLYILLAFVLAAFGCSRELEPEIPQGESDTIVLELRPMEAVLTRAGNDGEKDGVTEYNENLIGNQVHLFFYANNATDDSPALKSLVANVNPTTRRVSIPTSVAEVRALFGGTNSGRKCKVYVVANYNGATAIDHNRTPRYSRSELKELELAAAVWKDICDANGSFTPSDTPAFVMTGEGEIESRGATASPVVDGEVKMARVASKVSFSLTVSEAIDVEIYAVDYRGNRIKETDPDTGEWTGEYKKRIVTMKPNKAGIVVNLCYANKYAQLSADSYEPTGKSDPNLFDYAYRPFTADGSVLNAQPFYSYPQKWGTGAANQPYLKLVIPWTPHDETGVGSTKNYYYKIPLPEGELKRNNWYQIGLNVSILGGEEQEPIPVEVKYCVADWGGAAVESEAAVVSARYLSIPRKSFTMYNTEELEIPMISSHPCAISNITITYPDYTNNTIKTATLGADDFITVDGLDNIKLKHRINNVMGANLDLVPYTISFKVYQLSDSNYYADVTVVQYPAISTENIAGGSSFVDGYFAHVYDATNTGRVSLGNTYQGYYRSGTYNNTSRSNGVNTPYGSLHYDVASNYSLLDLTKLTVTAFQADYNTFVDHSGESVQYVISDPRVNSGWGSSDLVSYLNDNNGTTSWGETAAQIKVGTSETNVLAPALLFSSAWNSMRGGSGPISFTEAQKRCATYQEGGYPAGRWRLATEAEINFVARLQGYEKINELFGNNQSYWSSSGYTVKCGTNVTYSNTESTGAVRCVYDVWYWGDTAKSVSTYWPEPTDDN